MRSRGQRWAPATPGVVATAVLVAVLAGCSEEEPTTDAGTRPTSAGPSATGDTEGATGGPQDQARQTEGDAVVLAEGVTVPGGAAGEQLQWVLDTLATPGAPTEPEARQHLSPTFLQAVPAQQIPGVFAEIRGLAPFQVDSVTGSPGSLTAQLSGSGPLIVSLVVDDAGLIQGLTFSPDPTAGREPAGSLDDVDAELAGLGEQTHVLAARVQDGSCVPVHSTEADEPAPIGSVFKLYVLGALADAVEAGDVSWEDELEVTEEIRSLPSGQLQDAPPGTTVTVREAAELMIAISDNTATDLLIEHIGVAAIEDSLAGLGVQDPQGLTPFPTTAQFFQLGWGADDQARQAWGAADTAEQRQILQGLAPGVQGVDPRDVLAPRWEDGIGWFATAQEICAVHVALQQRAQTPAGEPLRGIVSANPGSPTLAADTDYLAFKGGSAPGTVTYSWYAETADGDPVVAVVQVAGDVSVDPIAVLGPAQDVVLLLTEGAGR